jgi:zinc protease
MRHLLCLAALAGCASSWVGPPRFGSLETNHPPPLDFKPTIVTAKLPSGLEVGVAPDRRTNLITVAVRYRIGAADDPADRPGLAHFVEHLLFELRERPGGPTLGDELAGLSLAYNAWTTPDELHFTTTAPASALDAVLALEARRMSAGCAQLDDATLARERDVVTNEDVWRDNPDARLRAALTTALYPPGHRYARAEAPATAHLTRADACAFIATHIRPEKALVVVGGPVAAEEVFTRVAARFPTAPRAEAFVPPAVAPASLSGTSRHRAPVAVPVAVVAVPGVPWGHRGHVAAGLAAAALTQELRGHIDDDHPWLLAVNATTFGGWRAPIQLYWLAVDREEHLDEAVALFFTTTAAALSDDDPASYRQTARLRGAGTLDVVADWDDVGRRGNSLADYLQYSDTPFYMLRDLSELSSASLGELRGVVRGYRRTGAHVAHLLPDGDRNDPRDLLRASPGGGHDLPVWRRPVDPTEAHRPLARGARPPAIAVERRTLSNGLVVELAPDPDSPIVELRLVVPGGTLDEPRDRPGLATVAAELLDHDYRRPYKVADYEGIIFGLERGTQLSSIVDERTTTFHARGLADAPRWHLWRLAWLFEKGVYDPKDLTGLRRAVERAARVVEDDDEEVAPRFAAHLFGADHPYARPASKLDRLLSISRSDLERWRARYFRPAGARLIVSGGFASADLWPTIEELFAPIASSPPAERAPPPAPKPSAQPVWLVDRVAVAAQTEISIGFPAASGPVADRAARMILAEMVRLRARAVRERMGASYGVRAAYVGGPSGSALVVHGEVAAAHAAPALAELLTAVDRLRTPDADFDRDFVIARRQVLAEVEASFGGARAMAATLSFRARYDLPEDDDEMLAQAIADATASTVLAVAARDLDPGRRVVELIGTAASVDAALAAVGATAL